MFIPELQSEFIYDNSISFKSIDEIPCTETKTAIGSEEYIIDINEDGIQIQYGGENALHYAKLTLGRMIVEKAGKKSLNYCHIHDYPEFNLRGIIEGFYGKPWSHTDRMDLIEFISKYKMNTFFYAPKDDLYHRSKWREPYPDDKFKEISELVHCCRKNYVDFIFSVSPGLDVTYSSEEDFKLLCKKFCDVMDLGVKKVALLLDDIDRTLKSKEDKALFEDDFVKAQVYISNKLYKYLKDKYKEIVFILCPTEYAGLDDTHYKKVYNESIDKDIVLIWTGYEVIAPSIPEGDASRIKEIYGHNILLWDNFPVNDGSHTLKLGPIKNRGQNLHEHIWGIISNPMNEAECSKPVLMTYADYCWNPNRYIPEFSYHKAMLEFDSGNYKFLKLLSDSCNTKGLKFENPVVLSGLIEDAIVNKKYDVLRKYLLDIDALAEGIKSFNNQRLKNELNEYYEKIKLTAQLGLKSLNSIEGRDDSDISDLLEKYKSSEYKFAGDCILDIVEYSRILKMSLKEKIGQMLMVNIDGPSAKEERALFDKLKQQNVGNVFFTGKYESLEKLSEEIKPFNSLSNITPLIGAEHEGGNYSIVKERFSAMFSQQMIGASNDRGCAFNNAYIMAIELKTLGINFILSPNINLLDELHDGDISRYYGSKINEAAIMPSIRAFTSANVMPCGKYFPVQNGLTISGQYDNLKNQIKAFSTSFRINIPALLISDSVIEELDNVEPACSSPYIINNILFGRLCYRGLTVSRLGENSKPDSFIKQLDAGINLFLVDDIKNLDEIMNSVNKLDDEDIKRINLSLIKVLKLKESIKEGKIDESKLEFYKELKDHIEAAAKKAMGK